MRGSELVTLTNEGSDTDVVLVGDRVWSRYQLRAAVAQRQQDWEDRQILTAAAPLVAVPATAEVDTVVTLLALIDLGIPFVPLHTSWSAVQRDQVLALTGALLLGRSAAAASCTRAPTLTTQSRRPITPLTPLGVVFTSGSTGAPKGVVLSHRAFTASAHLTQAHLQLCKNEVFHLSLPLAHVGGLAILTRALVLGGTLVLPTSSEPAKAGFDAERFVRRCAETQCTVISLVPTQLRRICAMRLTPPTSVKVVLLGGAHPPPALVQSASALGWPVHRTYGLTEACSQVATDRAPGNDGPLTLLPQVSARLEPDGRLSLRGPTLFSGYWGGPQRDDSEWFVTSDLATLGPEGLTPLGRADDLVISGGENIFPDEVDMALGAAPGVVAACCFGRESPEWGQELCAALIAGPDFAQTPFLDYLRSVLPSFKIPKAWVLVPELPVTATGKVSRRSCQDAFAALCQPFEQ